MNKNTYLRRRIGERIRQIRLARKWTQQQLAEKAGFDDRYVGAVERGERNLSVDNLQKFLDAFELAPHLFFLLPTESVSKEHLMELIDLVDDSRRSLAWNVMREILVAW